MTSIVAEPGTEDWTAARSTGIGASEAAIACGLSPYATPLQLYLTKRGELPPFTGNDATVRGTRFEPVIINYAEEHLELKLKPNQPPMYRSAKHDFMLATPDGEFVDETLLECKSSVSQHVRSDLGEEGTDEVPTSMLMQCQHQMAVTGTDVVHLVIVMPNPWKFFEFQSHVVTRHQELIDGMIAKEAELWDRIQCGSPPEPDWEHATTLELMKRAYGAPEDTASVEMLGPELSAEWAEYERCQREIKELKHEGGVHRAKVIHAIGDAFAGILDDGRFVRRAQINKKGHTVGPSSYVDVRAVKNLKR